jgi:hypothetical protein
MLPETVAMPPAVPLALPTSPHPLGTTLGQGSDACAATPGDVGVVVHPKRRGGAAEQKKTAKNDLAPCHEVGSKHHPRQ